LKGKQKMPNLDRRNLIRTGIALAVPFGAMPLLAACQQSEDSADADNDASPNVQDSEENTMQVQYLEIVTPDVDALCKQYSTIHGITFSEPNATLGNARTAKLNGGGLIGIRGPLRDSETPVIRPYILVKNLETAVAAAADAGAKIALPRMELPGHGTIAIVIQGGIECGLWQL
jgi:predicted enzyme related to lactoylglutathione lyase